MLDQQLEAEREAVRESRSRPLGHRELLPLDPRHDLPRRREPHPRSSPRREPGLAPPLRLGLAQTAPQHENQPRYETPKSRLVRLIPLRSPLQHNELVGASPVDGAHSPIAPMTILPEEANRCEHCGYAPLLCPGCGKIKLADWDSSSLC